MKPEGEWDAGLCPREDGGKRRKVDVGQYCRRMAKAVRQGVRGFGAPFPPGIWAHQPNGLAEGCGVCRQMDREKRENVFCPAFA